MEVEDEVVDPAPAPMAEEVILTRLEGRKRRWLGLIVLLMVLSGLALFQVWTSSIAWERFGAVVTLATIGVIYLAFSPFFIMLWKMGRRHALVRTIELDTDHLGMIGDRGVLHEIVFDSSVRVHMIEGEEDRPIGYTFSKGWSGPIQVTNQSYPDEDIERMWPVLKEAIRKHGMEADGAIRMRMDSKEG